MSLSIRDIQPISQFYNSSKTSRCLQSIFRFTDVCLSKPSVIFLVYLLCCRLDLCIQWPQNMLFLHATNEQRCECGRGLIWAHSSAVRELAQFREEKHSLLTVMRLHILFSWFKVLVESGLLKLRAYEILTTGCSHGWLSINVFKIGNPPL